MTVCGHEKVGLKFHRCCWCGEDEAKQEGRKEVLKRVLKMIKSVSSYKCLTLDDYEELRVWIEANNNKDYHNSK